MRMQEPFDNLTMVLEIAVFAAVIYAVLRFLRETRGAGVVRGLSLILISVLIGFAILIQVLALERLAVVFQYLTNIALIALVRYWNTTARRSST